MHFENHFDVDAPLERVWEAVLDVERVAPTVPGAQVLERTGDDAYKVSIKVKVGPMSMTYRGEVEITERDEAAHRAVMKARAKESRGQGTADADVTMLLSGDDGRTSATVTTDVALSGKVATMGQGVLRDVSGRLIDTFARNLAAMLEGEQAEPAEDALDLGALGGQIIGERLRRLAHRIVWVNPRKAAPGFVPSVGGMAAALPYCDAFVGGNSLAALDAVVAAIGRHRLR